MENNQNDINEAVNKLSSDTIKEPVKPVKQKKKKSGIKKFWILVGIGSAVVIILILLSAILNVGDKLSGIRIKGVPYVEIGFYCLSGLLFYVLIARPVGIILFAPTFSIQTVLDNSKRKKRNYKRVAKNLLSTNMLDELDVDKIKNAMNKEEELKIQINEVYQKKIKREMNKIIRSNAKTVMISTAISQNNKLDMVAVLAVNLKMIKELVVKCGFRPSMANLGKLSANVLGTALIAEGLENIDISEVLPSSATNFIAEVPFLKPIMSSVMQGISNALLTIRIGIVTRKYLFADTPIVSKTQIRIEALKESVKMLPIVIKDAIVIFPKKIGKLVGAGKVEEDIA